MFRLVSGLSLLEKCSIVGQCKCANGQEILLGNLFLTLRITDIVFGKLNVSLVCLHE